MLFQNLQSAIVVVAVDVADVVIVNGFVFQNFVLLASRPQKLFRHSFIALYEVYDIRYVRPTFFGVDVIKKLTTIFY
jgi:hypothetical protein